MTLTPVLLFLHVAAITLWVGGMFFAYVCLRPVALWNSNRRRSSTSSLARCVRSLLPVGVGRRHRHLRHRPGDDAGGRHEDAPVHWHLMFGVGLGMMLIFMHVYFAPYKRLLRAVDAADWPAGGAALAQIRKLVALNTVLGFVTIALATAGRLLVAG